MKKESPDLAAELYMKYRSLIYNIALSELGDSSDAEDAVQETMLDVIKYYFRVPKRNESEEKNYIARMARNAAHRIYNARKRVWSRAQEEENALASQFDTGPEDCVITTESIKTMKDAIKRLDKKYRDVLMMQKRDRLSIDEISSLCGVSKSCVTKRLRKGKEILMESLRKEGMNI